VVSYDGPMYEVVASNEPGEDRYDFLAVDVSEACQDILELSVLLPDSEKPLRCRLQANLRTFIDIATEPLLQRNFIDELDSMTEISSDDGQIELARNVDLVLKKLLGELWTAEADQEIAKSVKYVRNGHVMATDVVNPSNFVFQSINETYFEDTFPPIIRLLPNNPIAERIGHNIVIFNPHGDKVYWGDISEDDIKNLKGTYYILDENTAIHSVPDYAIIVSANQPAIKAHRLSGVSNELMPNELPKLAIDYVKARAIYAIIDGRLVPNNMPIVKTMSG